MFEVGFSEIAVIAVIALIVLGPERLPKAARMAGTFLRKARRSFESLKLEVERELEADELKKQLAQIAAAPGALTSALQQPFAEAKAALEHNVDAATQSAKATWQDISSSGDLDVSQRTDSQIESEVDVDAQIADDAGVAAQVAAEPTEISAPAPEARSAP